MSAMHQRSAGLLCLLVLALSVAAIVPVATQSRSLPDAPGVWKPWKPFSAIASTRQDQAATPALVKAFESRVAGAQRDFAPGVWRRVANGIQRRDLGQPQRVSGLRACARSAGRPGNADRRGLTFGAFPIFEYVRDGKTIREDTGETALQQFLVNQIGRGLIDRGNVAEWGPLDIDAFLQPLPQGEIAGLPRYGDGLVVARDPAALWTPLSAAPRSIWS